MPWYIDRNGERKYKISMYAKEELPTWSEVYDEFYTDKYYEDRGVDPEDPRWTEMDPYWKIEHYKFILAAVCNQFNKMLFEDGYIATLKEELVKNGWFVDDKTGECTIVDLIFTCDPYTGEEGNPRYTTLNCTPPIYTIPLPTGKPNPFITNGHVRSDITKFTEPMVFRVIVDVDLSEYGEAADHSWWQLVPGTPTGFLFDHILECMIKPYREYFENHITPASTGAPGQFDPAL